MKLVCRVLEALQQGITCQPSVKEVSKLSSDSRIAAAGFWLCFFVFSRTVWPENDHIVSSLCKKQVVGIAAASS